jgi:hypothetical protein
MASPLYPQIKVQLVGRDGNAFAILGRVTSAMRAAGLGDDAVSLHGRRRWAAATTTCWRRPRAGSTSREATMARNSWAPNFLAALTLLAATAQAEPLPQPKVGQCPAGYRESGGYCAPTSDRALVEAAICRLGERDHLAARAKAKCGAAAPSHPTVDECQAGRKPLFSVRLRSRSRRPIP